MKTQYQYVIPVTPMEAKIKSDQDDDTSELWLGWAFH